MEKLIFDITDTPTSVADTSALAELSGLMSTIREEVAFNEEAIALIDEVLSALPATERTKLLPTEHSQRELANSLSQQGEEQLLAVMKGVGA